MSGPTSRPAPIAGRAMVPQDASGEREEDDGWTTGQRHRRASNPTAALGTQHSSPPLPFRHRGMHADCAARTQHPKPGSVAARGAPLPSGTQHPTSDLRRPGDQVDFRTTVGREPSKPAAGHTSRATAGLCRVRVRVVRACHGSAAGHRLVHRAATALTRLLHGSARPRERRQLLSTHCACAPVLVRYQAVRADFAPRRGRHGASPQDGVKRTSGRGGIVARETLATVGPLTSAQHRFIASGFREAPTRTPANCTMPRPPPCVSPPPTPAGPPERTHVFHVKRSRRRPCTAGSEARGWEVATARSPARPACGARFSHAGSGASRARATDTRVRPNFTLERTRSSPTRDEGG